MNGGINIATMIVIAITVAVVVFTIDHLIGGLLWVSIYQSYCFL